jgi:hypothetical protein
MKALTDLILAIISLFILLFTSKERVEAVANSFVSEQPDAPDENIPTKIVIVTEKIDDEYYAWHNGTFVGQAQSPKALAKVLLDKFGKSDLIFPPMKITTTTKVSQHGNEKTIH